MNRPRTHRLNKEDFESLASGAGTATCVDHLVAVEHSWRMIQLRVLFDQLRNRADLTGPISPLAQAWELLAQAQEAAPPVVAELLRYPHVGTWASHTLRRLRGSAPPDPAPIWVDIGYLHALAAAAAIRSGLQFNLNVPVREGFVVLPTMGAVHFPSSTPFEVARVSSVNGSAVATNGVMDVRIPADPVMDSGAGWVAESPIRITSGSHSLQIRVEFLDPYRDLRSPITPEPADPQRLRHWADLLQQAWQLLVKVCPERAASMARGLCSITPLPAVERFRTMSASAGDAFGALIVSEPPDPLELAVTLVHEFQHIKLGALLHLAPLQEGEPPERLYAPWRDDPRPLSGLLQGVYAFAGVADFWRAWLAAAEHRRSAAAFEFTRWRQQVELVLQSLLSLDQLTDHGRKLLAELSKNISDWNPQGVSAEIAQQATRAVQDHRIRWRLHHLSPDPRITKLLADAWVDGATQQPSFDYPKPVVQPDPRARLLDTQAVLALLQLTDQAEFSRLRAGDNRGSHVAGATAADFALAAGEVDEAYDAYLDELSERPDRPNAWAGLRGVAELLGRGGALRALTESPELVRAVDNQVRQMTGGSVDRLNLAEWLSDNTTIRDRAGRAGDE